MALSKLRHSLGPDRLRGRAELELPLPPATFVDVEAALEGAHRAESAIAEWRWAQAWGPAGIAYHVATRPFLTGLEAPWIDLWRRRLEEVRLRRQWESTVVRGVQRGYLCSSHTRGAVTPESEASNPL